MEKVALCVAARNASEMGGTDEKELEARVRSNFKERLLYLEATCEYLGGESGVPTVATAVEERLAKGSSLWSKFQHVSAKEVRPKIINVIMPLCQSSRRSRRTGWVAGCSSMSA